VEGCRMGGGRFGLGFYLLLRAGWESSRLLEMMSRGDGGTLRQGKGCT
jgi:hypothetical protein